MAALARRGVDAMGEAGPALADAFQREAFAWQEMLAAARLHEDEARLAEAADELQAIVESLAATFDAAERGGHLIDATTLARKMAVMQGLQQAAVRAHAECA